MTISPGAVKALREKTGAGMMDCKRALVDAGGDAAKAERLLKEMGLAAAEKRMGRATNEGRVFSRIGANRGALLELSCETDFVARNSDFVALGERMVGKLVEEAATQESLEEMVKETAGIIKENMGLRRYASLECSDGDLLVDYIHGEGRIGVMLKFRLSDPALTSNPQVKETTFDFALHVAAFAPKYLSRDRVEETYVHEQEEIFKKQVAGMDKPENVLAGIVKGKLAKHLSEVCLLEQGFVKDEKVKCGKVLENLGKQVGGKVEIVDYRYFKVGDEPAA